MEQFLQFAMTILAFLLTLTIVVFVHEFGHFCVARWNGVKVETFSIGFGPELLGATDRRGTRWRLSLIPLGGYVKFLGDDDVTSASADESAIPEEERGYAFVFKSRWRKAAIVAAGPVANFLLAIVIFTGVFSVYGQTVTKASVASVSPESPAALAGVLPGDRIVSLAGHTVKRFEDIQALVPIFGVRAMEIVVERDGAFVSMRTEPQFHELKDVRGRLQNVPFLGVSSDWTQTEAMTLSLPAALGEAVKQVWQISYGTITAIGQMISGDRGTEDIGGPVQIAEYSGQFLRLGVVSFLGFIALLSSTLGLMNLLPIPLLDGGHLLFYAIEAVTGRSLSERMRDLCLKLGLCIVLGIMVFATWNDIMRLMSP